MAKQPAKPKEPRKKNGLTARELEQPPLPGANNKDDYLEDVHEAALNYKQTQRDYSAAGDDMVEARKTVAKLMHKHGRKKYAHGNVTVDLTQGEEKVKVKVANEEAE